MNLKSATAKAQTLLGQPLPRLVYDGCLQHVYCDGARGLWAAAAVGYPVGAFAVLLAEGLFFRWRAAFEKAQHLGR